MRCFLDAHVHIARKVIVPAPCAHVDAAEFLDFFVFLALFLFVYISFG